MMLWVRIQGIRLPLLQKHMTNANPIAIAQALRNSANKLLSHVIFYKRIPAAYRYFLYAYVSVLQIDLRPYTNQNVLHLYHYSNLSFVSQQEKCFSFRRVCVKYWQSLSSNNQASNRQLTSFPRFFLITCCLAVQAHVIIFQFIQLSY